MDTPVVGLSAGGKSPDDDDTGQLITVFVQNISNYDAHVNGAAAEVTELGPLVFRRYEQRYNLTRSGSFNEKMSYKTR